MSLGEPEKPKALAGRIVKTTDIDIFLRCDDMSLEELQTTYQPAVDEIKCEEEDDPEWAEVDVEEIKPSLSIKQPTV